MWRREVKSLPPRGVFERPPGSRTYWICYFADGRRHREKVGRSLSLAIRAYHVRKQQIREARFFPPRQPRVLFRDLAANALAYSRAHKTTEAARGDEWKMRVLLDWFGKEPAEAVTRTAVEQRLNHLATMRAPATVNRYRALLSLVFSEGIRNGKVQANPARLVRLRRENNARTRFLDADEEAALRAAVRQLHAQHEPELDLALHTGLRRGELHRLAWSDVDLPRGLLYVAQGKTGIREHVPLNSTARRALAALRKQRPGAHYVCHGPDTNRSRDWSRWFEKCVETAALRDFRFHDLRHTFGSHLVMAGVDLRTVQALMRHRSIQMTVRYAHLSEAHQAAAIERLVTSKRGRRS